MMRVRVVDTTVDPAGRRRVDAWSTRAVYGSMGRGVGSRANDHPLMDVLLGPIEARLDGRMIPLGAHKQRALLALLALHANRPVSSERIVEGLWGEDPPLSAGKLVQLYVSRLRRALPGDGATIVTRDGGYELCLDWTSCACTPSSGRSRRTSGRASSLGSGLSQSPRDPVLSTPAADQYGVGIQLRDPFGGRL
jgi:DNA-binding winged helix-turn-helix (wHTH) protein